MLRTSLSVQKLGAVLLRFKLWQSTKDDVLTSKRFSSYQRKCVTQTVPIQSMAVKAEICDVSELSKDVRGLKLKVGRGSLPFKAGQWVDFMIPGVREVGGYSICSSPKLTADSGIVELAIKRGNFPPTNWIFSSECHQGALVDIKVGGDFYYDPLGSCEKSADTHESLLLLAGGVGINPLLSILRHVGDLPQRVRPTKVLLAYSAGSLNEIIFKDEIESCARLDDDISVDFLITRDESMTCKNLAPCDSIQYHVGKRLDHDYLASLVRYRLDTSNTKLNCYICGPSSLIDSASKSLLHLGLLSSQINYEKWW